MKLSKAIVDKKQLLQTIGLTSAAFLIALPIGAAVIPGSDVNADETTVTRTVEEGLGACPAGEGEGTGAVNGASNTVTRTVTTRTITRDRNLVTLRNVLRDTDVDADVDADDTIDVNVGDVNVLNGNDADVNADALDNTAADVTGTVDSVLSEVL